MRDRFILKSLDSFLENINREEKKKFLINLLLLRQVDFKFEKLYQKLSIAKTGKEEDRDAYIRRNILYLPESFRWRNLKRQGYLMLKDNLYQALDYVRKENPRYRDILAPEVVLLGINEQEFLSIFDIVTELLQNDDEGGESAFVNAFEYIQYKFSTNSKRGGLNEFYVPSQIAQLLAEMIQPKYGSVYDPCCGSGMMLLSMANYMSKKDGEFWLYGQEADEEARLTAKTMLCLHGYTVDLGRESADVFQKDLHSTLKADYVLGNPPFSTGEWGRDESRDDERWKYGMPPKKRGSFAWLQHMLYHLKDQGKMGIILSTSVLESGNKDECRIRKGLVEDDVIEGIILLPPGMFHTTKIAVSLWLLNKSKESGTRNKILFVDARKLGEVNHKITVLSEKGQKNMISTYRRYQEGKAVEEAEFCRVVDLEEIKHNDFSLAPERYIFYAGEELPTSQELDFEERKLEVDLNRLNYENSKILEEIMRKFGDHLA